MTRDPNAMNRRQLLRMNNWGRSLDHRDPGVVVANPAFDVDDEKLLTVEYVP